MDEKINFVNLKYIIGALNVIHMCVNDRTPVCRRSYRCVSTIIQPGVDGAYRWVSTIIQMSVGQCTGGCMRPGWRLVVSIWNYKIMANNIFVRILQEKD
jgi:hypothetical protein